MDYIYIWIYIYIFIPTGYVMIKSHFIPIIYYERKKKNMFIMTKNESIRKISYVVSFINDMA